MNVTTLRSLLLRELRRTRETESTIEKSLIVWSERDDQEALRETLKAFLGQTRQRIDSLDRALQLIGPPFDASVPYEDAPIIREIQQMIGGIDEETARDAAMRASLSLLRHYLAARYDSLASWAERLRDADLSRLLKTALDRERSANLQVGGAGSVSPKARGMGERLTALFDKKE